MMFTFDALTYRDRFMKDGYVHIKNGVSAEVLEIVKRQAEEHMKTRLMAAYAIGDKQQALYEFPSDRDYVSELKSAVATVCGFNADDVVLSERHFKGYESTADPNPAAHKDRFASEISVGISVSVKEGSTLVLYPYDLTDTNPFNASTLLRASLSPDRYPEHALKNARRVEINDSPGDVIIFRGHRFWHLRQNPADTTMLYLKLNTLNCDPLGEDPSTAAIRSHTEMAIGASDDALMDLVPMIGRRVDYIHRMCNRNWEEVIGVVLWGEKHFTIDEQEFAVLKSADGRTDLRSILGTLNGSTDRGRIIEKVRRIARRGVLDLRENTGERIEI